MKNELTEFLDTAINYKLIKRVYEIKRDEADNEYNEKCGYKISENVQCAKISALAAKKLNDLTYGLDDEDLKQTSKEMNDTVLIPYKKYNKYNDGLNTLEKIIEYNNYQELYSNEGKLILFEDNGQIESENAQTLFLSTKEQMTTLKQELITKEGENFDFYRYTCKLSSNDTLNIIKEKYREYSSLHYIIKKECEEKDHTLLTYSDEEDQDKVYLRDGNLKIIINFDQVNKNNGFHKVK